MKRETEMDCAQGNGLWFFGHRTLSGLIINTGDNIISLFMSTKVHKIMSNDHGNSVEETENKSMNFRRLFWFQFLICCTTKYSVACATELDSCVSYALICAPFKSAFCF